MYLKWAFGLGMLPVVVAFALCLAIGSWVWERFTPIKVASVISDILLFSGLLFLAVATAAIVMNLFFPVALAALCAFATC